MNSHTLVGSWITLALFGSVLLASIGLEAKEHKHKTPSNQARVVAHIPLNGRSAVDMTLQKGPNDTYYLYVQHAGDQGISVVDISKPTQPKEVAITPWPDPSRSSRMNLTGNLAIIAESEPLPTHVGATQDDLVLWDMSNPLAPRVIQKFSGVVKWLQDERNFIYVLNGDGVWIVLEPLSPQAEETDTSNSY